MSAGFFFARWRRTTRLSLPERNQMTPHNDPLLPRASAARLHQFTVEEYHRLIALGILREEEHVELFEGYLVYSWPKNADEENGIDRVNALLCASKPSHWQVGV